ncbi:TetR/AcrR family transcriptional regulator [Paraliomyxa miuraensis]|uniref:TetR/AcrR family transcriptional regulator n=1 Tax=Paraliomyxa miuraensis TaxID=376150 RepID=UPI002255E4BF|nr:TetR/AcrR family transcriptional regulator [Paraliomyxa miuraensis]MCX4246208.1 TetR/AcrR family transcriptional regulator [Paraliomyxa miuraensis]
MAKAPPTEPRKRPRQARSRALVEAVLDATEQVIAQEGLAQATTTRIAEVAGVSVGSLYQYFPSRRALLAAVIERRVERDEALLQARLAKLDGASPAATLRTGAELLVELYRGEPELYRTMVDQMSDVDREAAVQRLLDDAVIRTTAMLAPHRDRLPVDDPALCAYALVTAQVAIVRDAVQRRPELLEGGRLARLLGELAVRLVGLDDEGKIP